MTYFTLLDVLERGGCIAYDHGDGNGRWMWVYWGQPWTHLATIPSWRHFGWGSKFSDISDVIWLMREHANSWVIVYDPSGKVYIDFRGQISPTTRPWVSWKTR